MRAYQKLVAHRRVLVNLIDGSAINGIVWDEVKQLLVMRDCWLHSPGGSDPVKLDGEVIIDKARVAFAQAVT